jgi:hypothetical protein
MKEFLSTALGKSNMGQSRQSWHQMFNFVCAIPKQGVSSILRKRAKLLIILGQSETAPYGRRVAAALH